MHTPTYDSQCQIAALREENAMLRQNMTLDRYSHDEIEAACGGETALAVRDKVMRRREEIIAFESREALRLAASPHQQLLPSNERHDEIRSRQDSP